MTPIHRLLLLAGLLAILPEAVALTYQGWRNETFSPQDLADASRSSESGDPDGDGRCNLLEYAFGSDPLVPDAGALELGSGRSALVFPESPSPEDLLLRLEFSDDLINWRWITPNPASRESVSGNGSAPLVRLAIPFSPGPRGFARLRITGAADLRDTLFAPSALAVRLSVPLTATLIWNDNARVEEGFAIERRTGTGGHWEQIGATGVDVALFDDLSASGSTDYAYRIRAIRGNSSSEPSNEATLATPLDTDQDGLPDADEAALGLNALLFSTGLNGAADGWWIRYGLDPFSPAWQDTDGDGRPDAREFLDGTNPVVADEAPGSGLPAVAPQNLALAEMEHPQLSWENVSPASRIQVLRTEDGQTWSTIGLLPGTSSTFIDASAEPATVYFYRLVALN